MDVLYIVIPAYNEEENIKNTIEEWYPIIEKYNGENGRSRLVIVDDGSKDSTFKIMQEYAEKLPYMEAVSKSNSGHGATVLFAYKYAVQQGADFIFQTDSDGQTRAEEFHYFWSMRNKYDLIIGYRNNRKDGKSRVFVTKVLKLVLKICFGTEILDANAPFRLVSSESLKECLKIIPEDYNLANVIMSVYYVKHKYDVKWVPITFEARKKGKNSINLKKIFIIGCKALADFNTIRKEI